VKRRTRATVENRQHPPLFTFSAFTASSAEDIPAMLRFDVEIRSWPGKNGKGDRMMRFEKRIQALEAKTLSDLVILPFADGSTESLTGRQYFLLDLFSGADGGNLNPKQAAQLDLIRKCVFAKAGARLKRCRA
jgi:hypothetical protein